MDSTKDGRNNIDAQPSMAGRVGGYTRNFMDDVASTVTGDTEKQTERKGTMHPTKGHRGLPKDRLEKRWRRRRPYAGHQ